MADNASTSQSGQASGNVAGAEGEHLDVLIVGAGISGIDAAYHLQARCPGKSYAILEARDRVGGTWDLFRFPGIRSDSDMYTLGFPFRPWRGEKAIVDGASIRAYINETAAAFGIDRHIRFGHRAVRGSWSSAEACWTVEVEAKDAVRHFRCGFLFLCSGYYDYAQGYRPEWPGEADFAGRIVHPQFWPEDLDVAGKKVVVIGSGATAFTLVPALAEAGASVTMLQRSPTYVVSRPSSDRIALWLQKRLPGQLPDRLVRWKNVLLGLFFFSRARKKPARVREALLKLAAQDLPPDYDVEQAFGARYNPWDQRLCLVPDGDLFAAIKAGRVDIITGEIDRFIKSGIVLASGVTLAADIVVTATGLVLKMLGGMTLTVDGVPVNVADKYSYKGMMLSDVPNLAVSFGYTNASWTLKCDLTSRYVCRLLEHMDRHKLAICAPVLPAGGLVRQPMLDFSSGYVKRAEGSLPHQGPDAPWRVHQNYLKDLKAMRFEPLDDGVMSFRKASPEQSRRAG